MMSPGTPSLGGARVVILHRPHPTVEVLTRQRAARGLLAEAQRPDLGPTALAADFVCFELDRGHDAQFAWPHGAAPMPMVALIGSEAPGRTEWAMSRGVDAQILKPVGDGGARAALLIALAAFEARRGLAAEIEGLRARLVERRTVVRAVALLAAGRDEDAAYAELRRRAMEWRVTIEEAAARHVAQRGPVVRRRPA